MAALESKYSNQAFAAATDTSAPAQVTGLAFTVEQGKVLLSWSANTESDLGGYNIYRTDDGVTAVKIAEVQVGDTAFIDTAALEGASYKYAVSAFDQEVTPNEGIKSVELDVKTIPAIPQTLTTVAGDRTVTLNWSYTTGEKLNENLAGFNVYRSETDGTGYVKIGSAAEAELTFTDSSVETGKTYYYVVTAFDNSL